jgi:hypothetical protein
MLVNKTKSKAANVLGCLRIATSVFQRGIFQVSTIYKERNGKKGKYSTPKEVQDALFLLGEKKKKKKKKRKKKKEEEERYVGVGDCQSYWRVQ